MGQVAGPHVSGVRPRLCPSAPDTTTAADDGRRQHRTARPCRSAGTRTPSISHEMKHRCGCEAIDASVLRTALLGFGIKGSGEIIVAILLTVRRMY
jgi:hypothetical protein